MSADIGEFSKAVLFKISRSALGDEYTGKIMTRDELLDIFGENAEEAVKRSIEELRSANFIKDYDEDDETYATTPFGEMYLSKPKPSSTSPGKAPVEQLNVLEQEILRSSHEHTKGGRRGETKRSLAHRLVREHEDWDQDEVLEAIDILLYQKYLKEKTSSYRHDPKVYNKNSKERPHTVKTVYLELNGKALLYLNNRNEKPVATASVLDKTTPYTVRRQLEGVFEKAEREILIGDNYLGRKTLDYLLVASVPVRILTSTTVEKNFDAALTDFEGEYGSTVEIKKKDGVLHGRFIVADDKYYLIDHSIKDFGAKPSAIIEITDPVAQGAYRKLFNDHWK